MSRFAGQVHSAGETPALPNLGDFMSLSVSNKTIGYIVQLGGIGALVVGAVLSVHHAAIATAFLAGAAAFYIGEKIRTLA